MNANTKIEHRPDYEQFLRALFREDRPTHLPFYEHIASPRFVARRLGVSEIDLDPSHPEYWKRFAEFWLGMGYDVVPLEIPLDCPLPSNRGNISEGSEAHVVIRSEEDFDKYPWPELSRPIDISPFIEVSRHIPEGAQIVGGVGMGPYEWVSRMMGVVGLSYALLDQPDLVEMVFNRIGGLIQAGHTMIAELDFVCATRQGDDLGFKTSTFLPPDVIRRYVLPVYADIAAIAHERRKPFVLHSCGNLDEIYEELIETCRIDGKHSFEETILPVAEFKKKYGDRITPLGGLDVDLICRGSEEEIRAYTRKSIDDCFSDGFWTLGTGNSLTDYMPVENYIAVLDEGRRYTA